MYGQSCRTISNFLTERRETYRGSQRHHGLQRSSAAWVEDCALLDTRGLRLAGHGRP